MYEVHAAYDEDPNHDDMIVCDSLEAAKELAADCRINGAIIVYIARR